MGLRSFFLCLLGAAFFAPPVTATETINYTYDARGRVIKVVHSGSVNNGVIVQYTYDKAGNRITVVVTGSP